MAALDTIAPPSNASPLLFSLEGAPAYYSRHAPRLMQPRPVVVRSNMDAASVLTQMRLERGWTGEELDARAGFSDRYTGKLERPDAPWGKRGLHISPMWEVWAEALGVCLVVVTKEQARQLGAHEAPRRPVISAKAA